jgi:aspartyl-tRNA(Asn)/glutamyl-tRNA(Gln) amidotransferase subunit B
VLTETRSLATYYEEVVRLSKRPKLASNWIMTEVNAIRNRDGLSIESFPVQADRLGALVRMIGDATISGKIGKTVFEHMLTDPASPEEIVKKHGLLPIDDEASLVKLAEEIVAANPGPAAEFRAGKEKTFGFFVGQAMKRSGGRAHPEKLQAALKAALAKQG